MEKIHYHIEVQPLQNRIYLFFKRMLDVSVSLLLLIMLAPFFLLFTMIAIFVSGKPVFYKQTRTGQNHEPFTIWKFRTMEMNKSGTTLHVYNWSDGVPNDFIFKSPQGQKVTKIGKLYRKFSIDELPQLINVLRGDMSLVGPRPEIPEITGLYSRYQADRLQAKPGMTGYAQINGRSVINHGMKIEYDLYYVQSRSFGLDIKIIFKTIGIVIFGKGAW